MSYTCGTGAWSGPLPGDPSTNSILTATPVFGGIDITWTPAIVNPHAVAHTYLYRSNSSDFVTAIRIATVGGTHFYDKLENLLTYYYWIQIVSINGTVGEVIGPASAIPRLSIDATIEALTGRIDNGVLAQSLKSEIDRISLIDGDLFQEIQDRIAANELLGAAIQSAQTDASQAVSLLNEEIVQRTTAYNVLLQTINTMAGQVNDNKAAIETETALRISKDEALAQQITNVQSATEDNLAAVQTTLQTNINTVNGKVTDIGALYTAKVQVNGLIGGFGVYNDGTEVQAGFDVDTFWVGRTGPDKKKPFIIDSATGETYIDKAVIPTLTADMIDTRGLSIKDTNGNIILAAGTALDWSRIGGSNKPADNATRNVFRGDWVTSTSYAVGDIVLKDGNGWSCVVVHTSSGANQPPVSGSGNTWWAAYTVKGGDGKAGLNFSDAKLLTTDPTFQSGTNGIHVYNNLGNGTVTITREAKQADSPFGDSAHNLRISNAGTASPYLGGFTFFTPSRANAQFVVRFIAKVPVGCELIWHSNLIGTNGESQWLSSPAGTGRFEEYLYFVRCGSGGTFSTTNFFALNGPSYGTPEAPINWYLAYAAVYDFTALGLFVDVAAATASANAANAALADIAADNKLTPVEKQSAANEWGIINRERASIQAQASALGISAELGDYNYTYAVLNDYITPLLSDLQSTSVIDGATFRDKWSYFYEYRQRLINKMSAVAATKADWASVSGSGKPENGATNGLVGAPNNLIPDDGFYIPGWWQGNRAVTTWPAGWSPYSGGPGQPARMLWINSSAGTFDKSSEWFDIRQGAQYRVRLRMYLSPDFSGFIAPLVHFPNVVWGIPGSVVSDPLGQFPAGHTGESWGRGSWVEREVIYTAGNPACIRLQTRICGRITAGHAEIYMEVTSLFAGLDQITPSNVSTYIANAAIGAAQIGSIELVGESAFKVRTNNTLGARMDMDSRRIKIFDASGTLRVQLGDLTV